MYQLVHYSYHNVPLGELVGTLWKIIYQLIHYGNIIAFQNQSYLQIRLEKCLISHQYNVTKGILNNIAIPYIQFADDLVLLATTAADLQRGMNNLLDYCKRNVLSVNISKTKAMIFHKGRKPKHTFFLDNQEIEQVSSFVYLGFTFTTQLSFSKHVSSINAKAASKCGFLFSKILTPNIPLHVALDLFNCYVLPSYRYGLSLWLGRASEASMCALNAVFSKFLKRYLGVNYHTSNSITHFLTNTAPLTTTLKSLYSRLRLIQTLRELRLQ